MIIDNPGKRPAWARHRDWVLSALMWLLYLYFIREALFELYELVSASLAWGFAEGERPHSPAISRFLAMIQDYGIVILANGVLLIVWALYNQFRIRGRDRRRAPRPVTVADLATLYGLRVEDVASWQQSRILTMRHAPDGTLAGVASNNAEKTPSMHAQGSRSEVN